MDGHAVHHDGLSPNWRMLVRGTIFDEWRLHGSFDNNSRQILPSLQYCFPFLDIVSTGLSLEWAANKNDLTASLL